MHKTSFKLIFLALLGIAVVQFWIPDIIYARIEIPGGTEINGIKKVSIAATTTGDPVAQINAAGFSVLRTVKVILQGVLLIFVVYIGIQMIMSMGSDEKELGAAKRQIWYAVLGMLFINIPGTIYNVFRKDSASDIVIGSPISGSNWKNTDVISTNSLIGDLFGLGITINDNIVGFLRVVIFGIAVFMFVLAGIQIITSQGREERIKESKQKIIYGVLALIFIGIIEAWKRLAFGGVIADGINIVQTLANLALFFAAPIAIFFLTLAGYYFITSAGDEERVKKAKRIIINVVIATVLLLASYTFLLDLAGFSII